MYIMNSFIIIHKNLIIQSSLGFPMNGLKKSKYPVSSSSFSKNALLLPEV